MGFQTRKGRIHPWVVFPLSLKSQQKHLPPPGLGTERADEAQVCWAPSCGLGWQWRAKAWLRQNLSVALVFGWAAGSGIWNSQDTDVPATLGSQPGILLSLIPIFGCCSHLIHIPMSTLHNLPQTLTAWELGKEKGQLMSRGRGTEGSGSGGEQEVGNPQKLPAGSTPSALPTFPS